eukprot:TRINITY_DN67_c0_g1_i9.p3 TRINITY_DN67_c0_g1~~TRINITY_DN67_c0_g1_i9.p3  ORF type:complete len:230 (-),score=-11.52 TRINITY_DN67_c0_g1_i9:39-728(-)
MYCMQQFFYAHTMFRTQQSGLPAAAEFYPGKINKLCQIEIYYGQINKVLDNTMKQDFIDLTVINFNLTQLIYLSWVKFNGGRQSTLLCSKHCVRVKELLHTVHSQRRVDLSEYWPLGTYCFPPQFFIFTFQPPLKFTQIQNANALTPDICSPTSLTQIFVKIRQLTGCKRFFFPVSSNYKLCINIPGSPQISMFRTRKPSSTTNACYCVLLQNQTAASKFCIRYKQRQD